ncbi:LacI family transcriptional regulator [Parapedobacter defluvii]|mgnify:CR=1 FL=1|uniref:LacI family transcriptional regulator n=1 Tax=Parapedobacter defluvii TaxID=2045106 RepID=A0ABQ1LLG8_9SPHI|nr:LacI family DNA-binding transcriptional regulator [Parapedobacter defluvii]RQP10825.1 MAG: LacI family transcriptional regulator [Parapedobacter sp.]GGC26096.1 LacI family transcriptional regulator [Parapedobacter defluvii]
MLSKPVTIKDIAAKLHLSVSTVSKALSDYPNIAASTKHRVKKLAKELNYVPNRAAIYFKQRKSFTLGIIVPSLMDHFYTIALDGFEKVVSSQGYHVIVGQSHESFTREAELTSVMQSSSIDGLLVSVSKETKEFQHIKKLELAGIPVVYFARKPAIPCHSVVSDVYQATIDAVSLLVSRGHRHIAYLNGPTSWSTSKGRFLGYRDGLLRNNIPFESSLVKETNFSALETHTAVRKLLLQDNSPTAILCFKDYIMLDVIKCFRQQFPDKIHSVDLIGFGALPFFDYINQPPLGSIQEQPYMIGEKAAEMLLDLIKYPDKERTAQQLSLPCSLKLFE